MRSIICSKIRSSSNWRCTKTPSSWCIAAGRWSLCSTSTRTNPSAACASPCPTRATTGFVLNTDNKLFGGPGLVQEPMTYPWQEVPMYGRRQSVQIYLPSRSAQVLGPV